jgi:hypothetical protein
MRYILIPNSPLIHLVPLMELAIAKSQVKLSLDDADEQRRHIIFRPYQAIRVTTEDCFLVPPDSGFYKGGVFMVEDSPWLVELGQALSRIDRRAKFLDKSYHYVIPSGDDIVEVVAWKIEWNDVEEVSL